MNIYVGNLPKDVKSEELIELFKRFGNVDAVRIIQDRETGQPRGFGFVDMTNAAEGEKAIQELNGSNFKDQPITVNEARERKPRRRFFRGGRKKEDDRPKPADGATEGGH